MNIFGFISGFLTLFIIGLGFPLVIQTERRLGYLWWPYMLCVGLLFIAVSLFIRNDWLCAVVAIFGATLAWGSTELKEQAVRAEIGWYPCNGKKIQPPFAKIIEKWKAPHL
jgi:hypothetical protein